MWGICINLNTEARFHISHQVLSVKGSSQNLDEQSGVHQHRLPLISDCFVMSAQVPPGINLKDDLSGAIIRPAIAMIVVTALFVVARLISRKLKKARWNASEFFILVSFVGCLTYAIFVIYGRSRSLQWCEILTSTLTPLSSCKNRLRQARRSCSNGTNKEYILGQPNHFRVDIRHLLVARASL